jgi:hypothetical protein
MQTSPNELTGEPAFPMFPPHPVQTQVRVTRLPVEMTGPDIVIEIATATPTGVHVIYLDEPIARRVADMLLEQLSGLHLPGTFG